MRYLENGKRADPRLILPECKSILALAIPYPPLPSPVFRPPSFRIASYARGADYHDVIPPKLQQIVAFIEEQVGHKVPNRYYTDTGPILERDLAARAGLGWIGKNAMLIHPKRGSTFLLAEILLGVELEPDAPMTDHCGTCTRCIQACPTGCILPNRTIDSRRCISYLTIENKGSVPEDLRPKLGDWVFGCDICQQVCPWNRFSAPGDSSLEAPSAELSSGDLTLSPVEFNRRFKRSPIQRAKRRGLLRNLAVAVGNRKDKEDVPVLEQAAQDEEALVREHAAWALRQLQEEA